MTDSPRAERPLIAFFRNDDVNDLTPELVELTDLLVNERVPIVHAVEPGNVSDECTQWLLAQRAEHGRLVQIMQHGYDHSWHSRGEFGGDRSYEDQYADLERGKRIMDERFGDQWFPAVNFPFGPYNRHSIRAVDQLGFRVINGHFNPRLSRRAFYTVGRLLRKGQILDKHVSHHLDLYPGTRLFCIDMAITYIAKYHGEHGSTECDWFDVEYMMVRFNTVRRHINVIGWLLHHRFHHSEGSIRLVADSIARMRAQDPGIEFWNYEEIHQAYGRPL